MANFDAKRTVKQGKNAKRKNVVVILAEEPPDIQKKTAETSQEEENHAKIKEVFSLSNSQSPRERKGEHSKKEEDHA